MTDKPKYKTELVNPPMAEVKKKVKRKVQVGEREETRKVGLFSSKTETVTVPVIEEIEEWQSTGQYHETHVDLVKFPAMIAAKANELAADGYRVISIMPVEGGSYKYGQFDKASFTGSGTSSWMPPATCFGYGFSFTAAAIITAELIES